MWTTGSSEEEGDNLHPEPVDASKTQISGHLKDRLKVRANPGWCGLPWEGVSALSLEAYKQRLNDYLELVRISLE
jgi:hypothetical protein